MIRLPAALPEKLSIGLDDVPRNQNELSILDIDWRNCPLVRRLRRVLPQEYIHDAWMYDNYLLHLHWMTNDGPLFHATLRPQDVERLRQFDQKRISPAGRTIYLSWEVCHCLTSDSIPSRYKHPPEI